VSGEQVEILKYDNGSVYHVVWTCGGGPAAVAVYAVDREGREGTVVMLASHAHDVAKAVRRAASAAETPA
jgi:hypothetical protein